MENNKFLISLGENEEQATKRMLALYNALYLLFPEENMPQEISKKDMETKLHRALDNLDKLISRFTTKQLQGIKLAIKVMTAILAGKNIQPNDAEEVMNTLMEIINDFEQKKISINVEGEGEETENE